MFNFGSMFASKAPTNNLSELLATPNVSLMRLLDDDTFISEFRSANSQVREYMTYKKFAQLVELITQVGDPFDKKRSYKFPLTAADLLASETPFVMEKLLPEEGVIMEEERVVSSEERETEQEVEADDDEDEEETAVASNEQKVKAQEGKEGKEEDEQFGDFVAAPPPKKKIIKVKEVVQTVTINKKQYPPLVDNILAYFTTDINHTLTSYCCKVLTSLINKRTNKFFDKFFEVGHTTNILRHIGSRSTVEFVVRVLTIETKEYLQQRLAFFKQLLQQASIPHELQAMSNISAALCETFQKLNTHLKTNAPCKQLQAYFNIIPQLIASTVDNIISEHEVVSVYSAPFIFLLLSSLPAELDGEQVDAVLEKLVKGALGKLEQAVQYKKDRLGVGRVKMIEILTFLLKRPKVREILSEQQQFFPLLFSLVKAYPLNNILHNEVFKIIAASSTSETTSLAENLFSGDKFILWLVEEAEQEGQRGQNSPSRSPRGYSGHLVNFCKFIRDTNNQNLVKFKEDPRFQEVLRALVDKVTVSHERNLGGYGMRKSNKFQILFTKEEILKQHAAFLSNARPAVFQVDLEDPLQNPALLQQLKRQLDGIQMESTDKPEEVVQEEKHKAELIEENEQHKSAFWKVHMDFNVDDLITEMLE